MTGIERSVHHGNMGEAGSYSVGYRLGAINGYDFRLIRGGGQHTGGAVRTGHRERLVEEGRRSGELLLARGHRRALRPLVTHRIAPPPSFPALNGSPPAAMKRRTSAVDATASIVLGGAGRIASRQPAAAGLTLRIIVVGTREEGRSVLDRLKRRRQLCRAGPQRVHRPERGRRRTPRPTRPGRAPAGSPRRAARVCNEARSRASFRWRPASRCLQVCPMPEAARRPAINPASLAAISAVGSVKYVPDVGGLPEAEAVLREFPKAADWNQDPRTICQARRTRSRPATMLRRRSSRRAAADRRKTRPPFELMQAHSASHNCSRIKARWRRPWSSSEQPTSWPWPSVPAAATQVEEMLGIAYLHKAAMDNGVFRQPGDLCLLPPSPGSAYAKTADAEKAMAQFLKYLQRKPDELEVRWLLNLAYMALGTYPDGVPPSSSDSADRVRLEQRTSAASSTSRRRPG